VPSERLSSAAMSPLARPSPARQRICRSRSVSGSGSLHAVYAVFLAIYLLFLGARSERRRWLLLLALPQCRASPGSDDKCHPSRDCCQAADARPDLQRT
jgi:hypothetical protein